MGCSKSKAVDVAVPAAQVQEAAGTIMEQVEVKAHRRGSPSELQAEEVAQAASEKLPSGAASVRSSPSGAASVRSSPSKKQAKQRAQAAAKKLPFGEVKQEVAQAAAKNIEEVPEAAGVSIEGESEAVWCSCLGPHATSQWERVSSALAVDWHLND